MLYERNDCAVRRVEIDFSLSHQSLPKMLEAGKALHMGLRDLSHSIQKTHCLWVSDQWIYLCQKLLAFEPDSVESTHQARNAQVKLIFKPPTPHPIERSGADAM